MKSGINDQLLNDRLHDNDVFSLKEVDAVGTDINKCLCAMMKSSPREKAAKLLPL